MSTANWIRIERALLDGEPFIIETAPASGGQRIRIRFERKADTPIEDDTVWPDAETARGRAFQMADEFIQQTLR